MMPSIRAHAVEKVILMLAPDAQDLSFIDRVLLPRGLMNANTAELAEKLEEVVTGLGAEFRIARAAEREEEIPLSGEGEDEARVGSGTRGLLACVRL